MLWFISFLSLSLCFPYSPAPTIPVYPLVSSFSEFEIPLLCFHWFCLLLLFFSFTFSYFVPFLWEYFEGYVGLVESRCSFSAFFEEKLGKLLLCYPFSWFHFQLFPARLIGISWHGEFWSWKFGIPFVVCPFFFQFNIFYKGGINQRRYIQRTKYNVRCKRIGSKLFFLNKKYLKGLKEFSCFSFTKKI